MKYLKEYKLFENNSNIEEEIMEFFYDIRDDNGYVIDIENNSAGIVHGTYYDYDGGSVFITIKNSNKNERVPYKDVKDSIERLKTHLEGRYELFSIVGIINSIKYTIYCTDKKVAVASGRIQDASFDRVEIKLLSRC